SSAGQQPRQLAPRVLPHVLGDQHAAGQIGGRRRDQRPQRLQAASRPADHHHITRFHSLPATPPQARHSRKPQKKPQKKPWKWAVRTLVGDKAVTGERLACETEGTVVEPAARLRWLLRYVRSPGPRLEAWR